MNTAQTPPNDLAEALRAGRAAAELSIRQLSAQSGVAKTVIAELENGLYKSPSPVALANLAAALELRTSDLFLLAGIPLPDDLPSLPVMLRTEYDLSPEAIDEVQQTIDRLARRHRRQQHAGDQPNDTH